METLESKYFRLSREQQREVEDFVDFLLQRQVEKTEALTDPVMATVSQPLTAAPPALTVQEPVQESPSVRIDDLIEEQNTPRANTSEDPATLLIQEIASEGEDILTADYMDYGKFVQAPDPSPSPATEAVQRVKIRLSGKKEKEGPGKEILDWID